MKKLGKLLTAGVALAISVMILAACGSTGGDTTSKADASSAASSQAESSAESKAEGGNADLSNPEITIEDGDYAAMETFAKQLQNGENEGKVVKITGINSRSMFGAKATVNEDDGSGKKIGTTYMITGVDNIDGYPADDAKIEITGVVTKAADSFYCYVEVPADKVVTK